MLGHYLIGNFFRQELLAKLLSIMMKKKHLNYTYKLGQKKCHTTSSGPMSIRQMESLV